MSLEPHVARLPPMPLPGGIHTTATEWRDALLRLHHRANHAAYLAPHVAECWPNGIENVAASSASVRLVVFPEVGFKPQTPELCSRLGGIDGLVAWDALHASGTMRRIDAASSNIEPSAESIVCSLAPHLVVARACGRRSDEAIFYGDVVDTGILKATSGKMHEFVLLDHVNICNLEDAEPIGAATHVAYLLNAIEPGLEERPRRTTAGLALIASTRREAVIRDDWSVASIVSRGQGTPSY
jgi:hypothetical protein